MEKVRAAGWRALRLRTGPSGTGAYRPSLCLGLLLLVQVAVAWPGCLNSQPGPLLPYHMASCPELLEKQSYPTMPVFCPQMKRAWWGSPSSKPPSQGQDLPAHSSVLSPSCGLCLDPARAGNPWEHPVVGSPAFGALLPATGGVLFLHLPARYRLPANGTPGFLAIHLLRPPSHFGPPWGLTQCPPQLCLL